jgi:hypothetical protein
MPAPARILAFDILRRVETGAWTSDLLLAHSAELDSRDAGLASGIVFGVLRYRAQPDFLIEPRGRTVSSTTRMAARLHPKNKCCWTGLASPKVVVGGSRAAFLFRVAFPCRRPPRCRDPFNVTIWGSTTARLEFRRAVSSLTVSASRLYSHFQPRRNLVPFSRAPHGAIRTPRVITRTASPSQKYLKF